MNRLSSPIRKLGVVLIAVIMVAALAGLAQAQKRGNRSGGERPNQEEMINRMISHLDLTDEQQEQMKQIHLEHQEGTEVLRGKMEAAHERLKDAIDAEEFDESAIREAAALFSEAQEDLWVSRARVQQEMREILTPEQYEQFQEMKQRHHGKMMRHSGGRGGQGFSHGGNKPVPEDG